MSRYRSDDIDLLLPTFRASVKMVLARMRARGYQPVPFDTMRTAAESAKNAAKGTGIKDSMHEYGVACDVICDEHGWSCSARDPKTKKPLNDCQFYVELREVIRECGCFVGPAGDYPHFQGIPVSAQARMRAMGKADDAAGRRDALVRVHLVAKA